jgi:PD-(D/E)XK nuclease superfamily
MAQPAKQKGPWEFARSTSQRRTYRTCGYKFLLSYGYGWEAKLLLGRYAMGNVLERLATLIALGIITDPNEAERYFVAAWIFAIDAEQCEWTKTQDWTFYLERGAAMARHLTRELPSHFAPRAKYIVQETLYFKVGGVPEVAIPDLYGPVQKDVFSPWLPTVLDFKTGHNPYVPQSIELDEQLTDYQLAEQAHGRSVEQLCLCVMVYQKEPRVQWLFSPPRLPSVVERFVHTAQSVNEAIMNEQFYQNDRACFTMGTCPYVPLCYDSAAGEQDEKLVKRPPRRTPEDIFKPGWD